MKKNEYKSQYSPQLNTKIMRSIGTIVYRHHEVLPKGWRCIIKIQDHATENPLYLLDIISDQGGGDLAPVKMRTLELFPDRAATGGYTPEDFYKILDNFRLAKRIPEPTARPILDKLARIQHLTELDDDYWGILARYGLTHSYGGIRIPYNLLITEHEITDFRSDDAITQSVKHATGEIHIAFDGAKDWENTLIAFWLFNDIQLILNEDWTATQIWYNLSKIKADPHLGIWLKLLDIRET